MVQLLSHLYHLINHILQHLRLNHSIGEPGTQLTMRTFHTGGVAGGDDITQGLPRVEELFEARTPKYKATVSEINGKVIHIEDQGGKHKVVVENEAGVREHITNYNTKADK